MQYSPLFVVISTLLTAFQSGVNLFYFFFLMCVLVVWDNIVTISLTFVVLIHTLLLHLTSTQKPSSVFILLLSSLFPHFGQPHYFSYLFLFNF